MRPGSVLEGKEKAKHPRAQTLTTLWLNHLVACASGKPTTSVQIGLNGAVQLDALSQSDALAELQNLVKLYQEAWHKPLPVARKTACAFAMTMQTSHEEDQAKSEAALQAAQQQLLAQSAQANWRAWPTETLLQEPKVQPKNSVVTTSKRAAKSVSTSNPTVAMTPY
jgi:exonuclease V gamma subunit